MFWGLGSVYLDIGLVKLSGFSKQEQSVNEDHPDFLCPGMVVASNVVCTNLPVMDTASDDSSMEVLEASLLKYQHFIHGQ